MSSTLIRKKYVFLMLLLVILLSISSLVIGLISGLRINGGESTVKSDKDLTCYFTINQNANADVTWYRNGVLNLTTSISCTSGVECHTSIGSGTIPNDQIYRNDVWNCSISFNNGTAIENASAIVTIVDTPPTQPKTFYLNGTEISNVTVNMLEDESITLDINSTDKDNDTITYTINDSSYCTVTPDAGILVCNPILLTHTGVRVIRVGANTD